MIMCYFGGSEDGEPTLGSMVITTSVMIFYYYVEVQWNGSGSHQLHPLPLRRDLIGIFKIKIIRLCYKSH